jgi:hypothetical protein
MTDEFEKKIERRKAETQQPLSVRFPHLGVIFYFVLMVLFVLGLAWVLAHATGDG